MPSFEYYPFLEAETALKEFHTMAKECVKKNAKENAEKSFQNANNKTELDARIQMVANDVVQRYGMFFVIPSPESHAVRRVPEITRPDSQPLPLPLPHYGFHVIDGRPVPKSNGALSPSGLTLFRLGFFGQSVTGGGGGGAPRTPPLYLWNQ